VTVSSSIPDGAVLTKALTWEAKVDAGSDTVSKVEFSIDGKMLWTETDEPYIFDEDGQVLPPWLLGNGAHVLSVKAVTGGGIEATAAAHVTVRTDTTANEAVADTYSRTVTSEDGQRVKPYRTADKGAFGEIPPTGSWTLKILPEGMLEGYDPNEPANPFVQPYSVSGNRLTLYGPAVWKQADPSKPSLFCDPEKPSEYLWQRVGPTLALTSLQQACADRDMVVVGTWTPS
jgi:hypothetical protein